MFLWGLCTRSSLLNFRRVEKLSTSWYLRLLKLHARVLFILALQQRRVQYAARSQGAESACCMAGGPASARRIGGLYPNSGGNYPAILWSILATFWADYGPGTLRWLCCHPPARGCCNQAISCLAVLIPSSG